MKKSRETQVKIDHNHQKKAKQEQIIEPILYEKFLTFMSAQKQQNLNQRIKGFYGKNFPINYRSEYKFLEQWQDNCGSQKQSDNSLLEQSGIAYFVYSFVLMLLNIAAVWTISVERYFQTKDISNNTQIIQVLLVYYIADVVICSFLRFAQQGRNCLQFNSFFFTNYRSFICIAYFLYSSFWNHDIVFIYVIEIVVMFILYRKSAGIYQYMKVMQFGLKYENQVKILDLLFNIFIQAHIFALVLFSASKINPDNNWVNSRGIDDANALNEYITSFYFACTTMLTIGYGDITPKCTGQIIVTIFIQIVGVVSFGYLLNEMGHTLSKMRQQSEELDRDLQTISKISKYYNLQKKLQNKAKNFIMSNQTKSEELKIEDENRLLMKLNQDLRLQINHENSLNVVKSCIFYLCHWSKNMQSQIAKRLQKRLFSPNQKLIAQNGKDRVYIIKKGRIDIYMNRYGANQQYRKLLKVIDTIDYIDVSDNIYGYTTVFSNRIVKLEGIAKQFTSTYSVNKEEFIECIKQNVFDFQYYHEIKCRIDQSSFCEEWETPSIKNIREHYCPSRIILIKKYRNKLQKSSNFRCMHIRRKQHKFRLVQGLFNKNTQVTQSGGNLAEKTIEFTHKNMASIQEDDYEYDDEVSEQVNVQVHTQDTYQKSYQMAVMSLRNRTGTRALDEKQNKKLINHTFQSSKEYRNFFRLNNISRVLTYLQKQNYMEKRVNDNISSVVNQAAQTTFYKHTQPNQTSQI